MKIKVPYLPKWNEGNYDSSFCNFEYKDRISTLARYIEIEINGIYNNVFDDFFYYDRKKDEDIQKIKIDEKFLNNLNSEDNFKGSKKENDDDNNMKQKQIVIINKKKWKYKYYIKWMFF